MKHFAWPFDSGVSQFLGMSKIEKKYCYLVKWIFTRFTIIPKEWIALHLYYSLMQYHTSCTWTGFTFYIHYINIAPRQAIDRYIRYAGVRNLAGFVVGVAERRNTHTHTAQTRCCRLNTTCIYTVYTVLIFSPDLLRVLVVVEGN